MLKKISIQKSWIKVQELYLYITSYFTTLNFDYKSKISTIQKFNEIKEQPVKNILCINKFKVDKCEKNSPEYLSNCICSLLRSCS